MKQYGGRHAILGRTRMNKKFELASSLHSSAIMSQHGGTCMSRHRGINGRGEGLKAGRETVYAAKGLDIHVRRTETIFIFDKT